MKEIWELPAVVVFGILVCSGIIGYIFILCERAVMKQHRRGDPELKQQAVDIKE
jgi:hypothetical protein